MEGDADRWNMRYQRAATGTPAMPQGLGGIELRRGQCLDVACGLGEQAIWAARQGYDVVALDVSPVAISALNVAAATYNVRSQIDSRIIDLDTGLPTEFAGMCALVICQRFRDPKLYEQLAYMLDDDGVLVITVLSEVGLTGKPGLHHAPPGELVDAFRSLDLRIERHIEADGEATLVARRTG